MPAAPSLRVITPRCGERGLDAQTTVSIFKYDAATYARVGRSAADPGDVLDEGTGIPLFGHCPRIVVRWRNNGILKGYRLR